MASIGKVSAVFTASTSGLTAGVRSASASLRGLQSESRGLENAMKGLTAVVGAQLFMSVASGAAAAASALAGLASSAVSSISTAVDAATSLGEETSKSAVIFGGAAAEVQKFADSAAAIGLSRQAALQATGSFGNLFTAMGLGSDQASEYARTMTALGADLASFNNATVEDSVQAIGAALRGEAEPIRRFGVLLDEATLKQAALSAGLISSTSSSLTPAIKAQAAYAAILQQTTKAQGDFARTGDSLANLSRVIQAQTSNIFTDIGSAFEPLYQSIASATSQVLTAVGPIVGQIAAGIEVAVQRISAAIQSLVPSFLQFVGTFDGANVGQAIGDGILAGARFLAGVGDFLIANFGSTFSYLSQVGQQWSSVWAIGARVGAILEGGFRVGQLVLNAIGGLLSDVVSSLFSAAAKLAEIVPGFGKYADSLNASADKWAATADGFAASADTSLAAAGQAFATAIDGPLAQSGQAIAGPLVTALNASIARAEEAASSVDVASKKPVELNQTVVVDVAQAIKGIDSRTTEGITEMFRIMRGGAGDVQEQQLSVLEEIAANTGGEGFTVVEGF